MNPDTARPTREPETQAGRSLIAFLDDVGRRSWDTSFPDADDRILAIEAELRASLAEQVRALEPFGERTHDADWGWRDCRNAAAALIEGTDPASPTGRETRMSASEDVERLERLALRTLHRRYLTTHDSAQRNAIWRDILAIDKMTMPPKTIRSLARLATDPSAPEAK